MLHAPAPSLSLLLTYRFKSPLVISHNCLLPRNCLKSLRRYFSALKVVSEMRGILNSIHHFSATSIDQPAISVGLVALCRPSRNALQILRPSTRSLVPVYFSRQTSRSSRYENARIQCSRR